MKKHDFIPTSEGNLVTWLKNYKIKLAKYATVLNISEAEVAEQLVICDLLISAIEKTEEIKREALKQTKAKDQQKSETTNSVRKMVNLLKAQKKYTQAIGADLGIIGEAISFDPNQLKPVISGLQTPKGVVVKWNKGSAQRINIYVDRNDGKGFVFLATDSKPDYTDTFNVANFIDAQAKLRTKGEPIPGAEITLEQEPKAKSAVWQYYAIYVINDDEVGKRSDVISVTVTV